MNRYLTDKKRIILILTGIILLVGYLSPQNKAQAQVDPQFYSYPYNHLPWYTIDSRHFMVHFQKGNSRSAQVISKIAEEVYPYITELYNHKPDSKVSIMLRDREDYSNGAAYFFDNKIDIWVPPLQTPLRGTHDWYRNVITHEFVHIIQLQAAMKRDRSIPAVYFQWLSYEDVRRPDVLYGYPKGIVSYPFASISIPAWLAEGTAQYQRRYFTYDTWDSHRDMILRTNLLENTHLTFEEMGTFSSKTSIEHEMVYNQGFAFTSYLADRFGEKVLYEISNTAAESNHYNIDRIIREVTGQSGNTLFQNFTDKLSSYYRKAVSNLEPTPSSTLEKKGFYNFYPVFKPHSDTIAYLSNQGRDYSRVSLYMKPASSNSDSLKKVSGIIDTETTLRNTRHTLSCGFTHSGEPDINYISTAFSFSPEGRNLVYTKARINKFGEEYRDLYIRNLKDEESRKITADQRVQDPAWGPNDKIAAVRLHKGTLNLILYNTDGDTIRKLTEYADGEIVSHPVWTPNGQYLYFSYADSSRRSIRRYALESGTVQTVLKQNGTDYRDPSIGPDGKYLYYAANPDGIFNIYRKPLGSTDSKQLTSVIGGAFMPSVNENGTLLYAEYKTKGYTIVSADLDTLLERNNFDRYRKPDLKRDTSPVPALSIQSQSQSTEEDESSDFVLNEYNDDLFNAFTGTPYAVADTGSYPFDIETRGGDDQRIFRSYDGAVTDFTFYPVIRFDNYSKLHGSNGKLLTAGKIGKLGQNLIRDFKAGVYFGSREVIERLSIFGGGLIGLGSQKAKGLNDFFKPGRLVDLDRDLFLIAEYRGLPFIERYWSPTVSVELYNLRRNVRNGVSIEEFPCTSCLPDTTKTDVAYGIWEADLFLRSKLSRNSLIELGIQYSPYRVSTEGFVSKELKQYIPGSTSQYFKGATYSLAYNFDMMKRHRHSDIAPIGLKGYARYAYEPSELLQEYEVEEGTLSPVFRSINNHSLEAKGRYGFPLWRKSTAQLYSRFFTYLTNPDDYFYLDYIGGFTGMRSYPFFALGGNTTAFTQLSLHTPVITDINKQFGRYTLDKLYARLYLESGNGWRGPLQIGNNLKTGVGAELRFAFNGYYLFPLKLFVSGSYGFNKYDVTLPSEFITGSQSNTVTYGRDLLFHFGLTFDFEVLW